MDGGFGNLDPARVYQLVERWGTEVDDQTDAVFQLYQARLHGREPATCLLYLSPGGSAPIGTRAVRRLLQLTPTVRCYGFSLFAVEDLLAQRMPALYDDYRQAGCNGFFYASNLGPVPLHDLGLAATTMALAAAEGDAGVQGNNILYHLFEHSDGVVAYGTWLRNLPAERVSPTHAAVPPRYFVYRTSVLSSIYTGLSHVRTAPAYSLIGEQFADQPPPLTSRYDLVLVPVPPSALADIGETVTRGMELKLGTRRNYRLLVVPTATVIDPDHPVCPIVVLSLQAVPDRQQTFANQLRPPAPQLAPPAVPSLPAATPPSPPPAPESSAQSQEEAHAIASTDPHEYEPGDEWV